MRIVAATYNIHFGVGVDGAYDLGRIVEAVEGADIVCLQEVVQGWPGNDFADQAAELAAMLNYHYVHGSTFNVDSSTVDADGRVHNRRRTFGNMVASRWPISAARTLALPHSAEPGVFDLQRCALETVVEVPESPLRVYSVHLSHISTARRRPQVQALLEILRHAPYHGRPWDDSADLFRVQGLDVIEIPRSALVMGDFNFSPHEPEYSLICGEAGEDGCREPRFDQLFDAWVLAGNAEGEGDSFFEPLHPGYRIDHALVTHDLRGAVRRAWLDREPVGSDHFPVFVELDLAE